MDFIEQWFHVSPDGGSGLLELAFSAIAVAIVSLISWSALVRGSRARMIHRMPGP